MKQCGWRMRKTYLDPVVLFAFSLKFLLLVIKAAIFLVLGETLKVPVIGLYTVQ